MQNYRAEGTAWRFSCAPRAEVGWGNEILFESSTIDLRDGARAYWGDIKLLEYVMEGPLEDALDDGTGVREGVGCSMRVERAQALAEKSREQIGARRSPLRELDGLSSSAGRTS